MARFFKKNLSPFLKEFFPAQFLPLFFRKNACICALAIFAVFMRAFLLLLFSLLVAMPFAQAQKYKRTLRGEVRIPGHPPQYYYIYYIANGPNIGGYSVTQSDNGDLKAGLMGRLSDDGQELYLRETQSMDEDPPGMTLCFFAARLKLTASPGKRVWSGPFSSRQADGTPCEGGVMTFVDLDPTPPPPPKPVAAKPPVVTRPPAPKPVVPKPVPTPAPKPVVVEKPKPKPTPLAALSFGWDRNTRASKPVLSLNKPLSIPSIARPGKMTDEVKPVAILTPVKPEITPKQALDTGSFRYAYTVKSDSLRLEIWDGAENDGDVISLRYDGRDLLLNEKLQMEKKILVLPVRKDGWSTLSITLLSEGTIPENTVALILKDGIDVKTISINGSNGQVANLFFRKTEK